MVYSSLKTPPLSVEYLMKAIQFEATRDNHKKIVELYNFGIETFGTEEHGINNLLSLFRSLNISNINIFSNLVGFHHMGAIKQGIPERNSIILACCESLKRT